MNNGDNTFGTLAEPNQTILVQGLNVASLKCETDTPIAIGGTVRSAQLQAPIVDILESGVVAGELVADEVVIRGTAENVTIRAKRFFATGTAKIQNCTLFLEGVSGCSIHQGAELTGDFRITTAAFAAAPAAPAAPVAPVVAPAAAAPSAPPASAKPVKVEVKPAPAATPAKSATTESAKSSSTESSVWGDVDQVMRSSAETEDGHASLMGAPDPA
ncbi:hypothetical protein [Acetobacter ghanensis]|uniref:Polymer-forming cytoskeletal protein n=1 Tax=Acetobacter ghanensis TaxID=431306 RepID=A0A0U4Y8U2_9PROT|nr:hypothetical protein [Acetobacter ghanensis]NHO39748.1 hypothetical protein [Acetobacter ghanensis]GBQ49138.1 hypothetical protein AA18895_1532 [Acetobacter ghanensis DSM 18895]CEF53405.1 hypothetical protein predicted by Glimmer/Critica [Acetobacter ghanensis]